MKKWMFNALIWFFAAVFVVSAGMLIWYWIDSSAQSQQFEDLSAMVQQARPTVPADPEDPTAPTAPQDPWITVNDPETGAPVQVLPEFAQLYTMNNDLVGWIRIPDTRIDYPVMQTPDSPDYYLRRSFEKKKATHGCIYAKEECDLTASDNVTLYGHYMRNGSMFAALGNYKKIDFWEDHKYILLDSLTQRRQYEIFAVFLTTASEGKGFRYHTFMQADSAQTYDDFVSQCKELSLYDTGITPQYGEKLITLSTCEYSQTNGRLVVVARLVSEE